MSCYGAKTIATGIIPNVWLNALFREYKKLSKEVA